MTHTKFVTFSDVDTVAFPVNNVIANDALPESLTKTIVKRSQSSERGEVLP